MAKQQGKNTTSWSRFRLWVENNQKVVWVLLLLLISPMFAFPVSSFMSPSGESRITVDQVYGERISQADHKRTRVSVETVSGLTGGIDYVARFAGGQVPGPLERARALLEADPLAFHIFKKKALQMGLRVTDQELAEHVRELWQWAEAATLAGAEVESRSPKDDPKDPSANWRRQFETFDLAKKKKADLEAARAFDGASWSRMVEGMGRRAQSGLRVKDFEEVLRDLYLIAKLEDSVRSSVDVTPEEAYEKYRRDSQTRKLSWTELEANDALKEAASRAVTAEDVKAYHDAHASEFEKGTALRARWLLVPLEHFKVKAAAEITEEDLKKHYEENRNDYRRPTILAAEHSYTVRSQEESAKVREAAYRSFEEVKEKVREDAITKRASADMSAFATQIRTRLHPQRAVTEEEKKAPAASFESLAKEFPFLGTGAPPLVSRDEAKDAFGDAYTAQVATWFTRADSSARSGQRASIEAPEFPLQGEKGMVYYEKPELRERFRPTLKDVEAKVRDRLVKAKAAGWIADALAGSVKELNEGKKTLEEVAAAGIDVNVPAAVIPTNPAPPTNPAAVTPTDPAPVTPTDPAPVTPTDPAPGSSQVIHIAGTPVQTSGIHVSKSGPLMVPKPEGEAEKDATAKKDPENPEKEEVAHAASAEIIKAAFGLEKRGEAAVARSEEEAEAFLVRFDDLIHPDPAGFAARKDSIEKELQRSKQEAHLTAWRNEVLREARGRASASGDGAPEKAEADAGSPPGATP